MASPLLSLIALVLLYYTSKAVRWLLATRRPADFPPGPPILLGLGNLHQIALLGSDDNGDGRGGGKGATPIYMRFSTLAHTYGDMVGLKIGAANAVVLNHARDVHALLERRGALYSGRVPNVGAEEYVLYGGRKQIIFLQNGACLRRWRAAMARHLMGAATVEGVLLPMLDAGAEELAHNLLKTTATPEHVLRRWAVGTALAIVAGARLDDCGGDAFAAHIFGVQKLWLEVLSPLAPSNFVPFLRYLPEWLAPWKRKARCVREAMEAYSAMLLAAGRRNRSQGGTGFRCFLAGVLDDIDAEAAKERDDVAALPASSDADAAHYQFDDADLAYMASGLVDAAIDTTSSAVLSFVLFMAAHPEAQRRVHEELDGLVCANDGVWPGPKTLLESAAYLRACVYEVVRMRPPGPIALPHRLDQDDVYRGYRLPKGTIVIVNAFGIQNDPRAYAAPDVFRPERFLQHPLGTTPESNSDENDSHRLFYTFGAGRRGCPGERTALTTLQVAAVRMLYAFDVQPVPGAPPLDLGVRTGYHAGLTLEPKPFEVQFVPRMVAGGGGDSAASWVRQEYERLRPVLDALSQRPEGL